MNVYVAPFNDNERSDQIQHLVSTLRKCSGMTGGIGRVSVSMQKSFTRIDKRTNYHAENSRIETHWLAEG